MTRKTYCGNLLWQSGLTLLSPDETPTVSIAYNAFGRQVEAHDVAGITTFLYDSFGSLTNETIIGLAGTNSIDRFYDNFGRDTGYALNGVRQSTLGYDSATARLLSMQISRTGGSPVQGEATFSWSYLPGSDLKSSLAYPNGLSASWAYDAKGHLLQVCNATPTNIISQYDYTYDAAGRRVSCAKSGSAFAQNDTLSYGYNEKSELTNAVASVDSDYRYAYDFDDIGNRETSSERGTNSVYAANQLNQYTAVDGFTPQFDDDGNQTLVKTATGIWSVAYNGENRPILWTCIQSNNTNNQTIISMSYDRMGRRVAKNAQRFVYDGYLQIADNNGNAYIWDPSAIVATRPLVWQCGNSVEYYTHDGNKNVSEVVAENGDVAAHYEYAPFGAIVAQRGTTASDNPWRFSNEYADDDTGTVYYNYRHYEPVTGRWLRRDILHPIACLNPYGFKHFDFLGLRMIVRETDDVFDALDFLEKTAHFHGKFGWHPVSPYSRAEGERKNQKCCAITGKDTEYFRWLKIKYEPDESDYEIDMVDWKHGPNVKEEDQEIYDKLFDIVFEHEDEHRKIYETHLRLLKAEFQEEDSNCVKDNVKSFNDLEKLIHDAAKKEFNKKKKMHDVAQAKFDQEELESGRHAEFNKILTEYKDKRKEMP